MIKKAKFQANPWKGPFVIEKVNDNGTLRIQRGSVFETINIRQVKPFFG